MNEEQREWRIDQQQCGWQRFSLRKGWFRFVLWGLCGLFLMISLHAGTAVATDNPNHGFQAEQAERSPDVTAQSLQSFTAFPLTQLVQQAEDRFYLIRDILPWKERERQSPSISATL